MCSINILQSSEFTGLFVTLSISLKISGDSVSSSNENPGSDIILELRELQIIYSNGGK